MRPKAMVNGNLFQKGCFQAVKSRQPVVEDAVFGHNAALACHMANESYFRKAAVTWDAASNTIKS